MNGSGAERRIAGVAGERQVQLAGSASERFGGGDVARHRVAIAVGKRHADHIRERVAAAASGGGVLSCDLFEEAADLVGRMAPAVGLALDELLQHRDGRRLLGGHAVLEGAGDGRDARKPTRSVS